MELTPGVKRTVVRLGDSLRTARLRRRLSQRDMALVMGVSVGTVQRIEGGDPGVAIGNIAMAFLCLNCLDKLANVMDPTLDEIGTAAESLRLPQRVRSRPIKRDLTNRESSNQDPIAY